MAASQLVSSVNEAVTCSICLDYYTDPRSLPCVHTFCMSCLRHYYTNKQPGNVVPCPICRSNFTIPGDGLQCLPKNFIVDGLVNSIKIHDLRLENEPREVEVAGGYAADGQNYGISGDASAQDNYMVDTEEGFKRLRSYIKECINIFPTSGVRGCRQFLVNKMEEWKTFPLNIAVIGFTGVGKSCFINAIRYITADHPLAARVGVVETTLDINAYPHPKNKKLNFWDLPGAGTSKCPKDKYLERIQVDRYDFFLLMITGRSTEIDTWLCQEILKRSKQFYIVRTQVGRDLYDNMQAHPNTHRQEVVLDQMRQNAAAHLAEVLRPAPKVFLIDNFEQKKFDFPELERNLTQDFPELKRRAFVLSMSACNEKMIKIKAKELRASLQTTVVVSVLGAAKPVPGLSVDIDLEFIIKQSKFYFEQLGLDNESLQIHATLLNTSSRELQEIVKKTFPPEFFSAERLVAYIQTLNINPPEHPSLIEKFMEIIERLKLLLGILEPMSVGLTYKILESIINETEKVALKVMQYKPV